MPIRKTILATVAAVCLLPVLANATILTFDIFGPNGGTPILDGTSNTLFIDESQLAPSGGIIPNNYGDRVVATSDATGLYGQGNGFTPNVVADYRTRAVTGAPAVVDGTSNTILFGDGSVRFVDGSVRFGDGSVRVGNGQTVILADGSVRFVSNGLVANLGDGTVAFGEGATGAIPGVDQSDFMRFWRSGFGALGNVAYPDGFLGIGEITLTADPGFLVRLNSFDLAGIENNRALGLLQVWDGSGNLLWDYIAQTSQSDGSVRNVADGTSNTLLFAETPPPLQTRTINDGSSNTIIFGENDPGFSSFQPGVQAPELHLLFGASGTVGIDNVNFDQVTVPEPATMALAGIGVIGMRLAGRRKTAGA